MTLLSHLSPDRSFLPRPADARRLALGAAAWDEALAAAADPAEAARARVWSATQAGRALLAAVFGNSPFLSGVATAEWAFLTRLVENGADSAFDGILTATRLRQDSGENRAALMRR
ncbi:MAG: hypothetical protein ACREFB_16075, partial [Stellaceae bacterium]